MLGSYFIGIYYRSKVAALGRQDTLKAALADTVDTAYDSIYFHAFFSVLVCLCSFHLFYHTL